MLFWILRSLWLRHKTKSQPYNWDLSDMLDDGLDHQGWSFAEDTRDWPVVFRDDDVVDFLAADMNDEAARQGRTLVGDSGFYWTLTIEQMRNVIEVAMSHDDPEHALIEIVAHTPVVDEA